MIKADLDAAMIEVMGRGRPTTILASSYFADTLAAVQRVYDEFSGRDRRRVKRELRKAHRAVDRKHRGKHG